MFEIKVEEHHCATCERALKIIAGRYWFRWDRDAYRKFPHNLPKLIWSRRYSGGWLWAGGTRFEHWECPECVGPCYNCHFEYTRYCRTCYVWDEEEA